MNGETELTSIYFLEQAKSDLDKNAQKIKERNQETLNANFQRAMEALNDFYFAEKLQKTRFTFLQSKDKTRRELERKSELFKRNFDINIFSNIAHRSDEDLEAIDGLVTLKSANQIELEIGTKAVKHQGDIDEQIGSHNLIFANSKALPSRSFVGAHEYRIDTNDACVIPMDIADVLPPGRIDEIKYLDALQVLLVSKNLFSAEDFESFFSTYCATIFDTPEQAINFFTRYSSLPRKAGVWENVDSVTQFAEDSDKSAMIKIRSLYANKGIIPPFYPEWQFKDQVQAIKVD